MGPHKGRNLSIDGDAPLIRRGPSYLAGESIVCDGDSCSRVIQTHMPVWTYGSGAWNICDRCKREDTSNREYRPQTIESTQRAEYEQTPATAPVLLETTETNRRLAAFLKRNNAGKHVSRRVPYPKPATAPAASVQPAVMPEPAPQPIPEPSIEPKASSPVSSVIKQVSEETKQKIRDGHARRREAKSHALLEAAKDPAPADSATTQIEQFDGIRREQLTAAGPSIPSWPETVAAREERKQAALAREPEIAPPAADPFRHGVTPNEIQWASAIINRMSSKQRSAFVALFIEGATV